MSVPLKYAPWCSDVELAFYTSLAHIKITHDKLDSSARKVLGLYEVQPKDAPERSMRMQIHGNALTTDEYGFCRGEGVIRNFNTIEDLKTHSKPEHLERAGRTVWDAINDGTIYSCPSLLASFTIVSFADLKKYRFTYHFAYPAIQSEPLWRLVAPETEPSRGITKLGVKETTALVDTMQTWRYSVDTRQHGFFLAKRMRKDRFDWSKDQAPEDGNLRKPKAPITPTIEELGFLWSVAPLESYDHGFFNDIDPEDRFVCFVDPSNYPENPGWMLRNLLVLVRERWKLDEVQIMCYRDLHYQREHPNSLIMTLRSAEPVYPVAPSQDLSRSLPLMSTSSALKPGDVNAAGDLIEAPPQRSEQVVEPDMATAPEQPVSPAPKSSPQTKKLPKVTGWERDSANKLLNRTVDLAAYLDPARLADQAVDLNLQLIKWRISPSIDLDTIKHTSCLLLGAGTLGSYIARNLMGWGVRKISFVDNGRVSYSNPVRQPLYTFEDCQAGGKRKAERAAEALKEIYPGVDSRGYHISVPMAGHPIMDEAKVKKSFDELQALIDAHDAIFLLMDTREARWLPTVMGKAAGKIVINAALGFDTYVLMRHGLPPPRPRSRGSVSGVGNTFPHNSNDPPPALPRSSRSPEHHRQQPTELGCYFCTDVVAPADSLKSATLDQQCTVTRPGIAPLASALAVELLVSMTQHRLGARAPAPDAPPVGAGPNTILPAPPTTPGFPTSHPLGTIPHTLRGYLSTWQTIQITGKAYDCCAACSPGILERYTAEGWDFVKRAIGEKGFVEEVSGLAEVQRQAEDAARLMDEDGASGEDGWGSEGEGEMI
ncbi:Autophagy protein 7 [Oleoguttula sp. CCFEE 5521]